MSDQNMNPNTNPNGDQGNGTMNATTKPAKENFLVSGFKRAKHAVTEGWKEIKNHPVTHGICAALGVTAGGFVAYKVATSMQPVPQMPEPVPQIAEPEPEKTEENPNPNVEYVDIPQTTTSAAESE